MNSFKYKNVIRTGENLVYLPKPLQTLFFCWFPKFKVNRKYCHKAKSLKKKEGEKKSRMAVHGELVEPAVCLSDLYDVFLLDIVRDTRQTP